MDFAFSGVATRPLRGNGAATGKARDVSASGEEIFGDGTRRRR